MVRRKVIDLKRTLRAPWILSIAVSIASAAVVTWSVVGHGLPQLRHDWRIPADASALLPTIASYASGWTQAGLGAAQPYPTFYLIAGPLWFLARLGLQATPLVALVIALTAFLAANAGLRLARNFGASTSLAVSAALLVALNPWVFSKLVAGHIYMVLAYALMLQLIAETTRARPRRAVLLLLAALSITQIEFYAIGIIPLLVWSWRNRFYSVASTAVIAAAPIAFGFVFHLHEVAGTPYLLPWQRIMSVPLRDAVLMQGYAFQYAQHFDMILPALVLISMLSLTGFIRGVRDPKLAFIWMLMGACVVFASGTSGPISPLYEWLVTSFVPSGLFRELYDLIAIVPIAYAFGIARLPAVPVLRIAIVAATVSLSVPWLLFPAFEWFVPAPHVPHAILPRTPAYRVALVPLFQPMKLRSEGSGVDPDAYVHSGRAIPVNEAFPLYPVNRALSTYADTGDDGQLRALGVSTIEIRHDLTSDVEALKFQAISPPATPPAPPPTHGGRVIGLFTLWQGTPTSVSLADDLWQNDVFIGDWAKIRMISPQVDRRIIDPSKGWADARLGTLADPTIASPFGGVLTTTSQPFHLPCAECTDVLLNVQGAIVDEHGTSIATTPSLRYRWARLPHNATQLICHGYCAVALFAKLPPYALPERSHLEPNFQNISFEEHTPWLTRVRAPGAGTLRYNVRWDPFWLAVDGGTVLPHVRLDTAVNGWVITRGGLHDIWVVNWVAAAQAGLMLAVAFALFVLCFRAVRWRDLRKH